MILVTFWQKEGSVPFTVKKIIALTHILKNPTDGHSSTVLFAWLFLSTGVFAIIGALFSWGEGWLFSQKNGCVRLVQMADLVVAGPISLLAAWGLFLKKRWGIASGLMASGIYVFGSALVYIQVFGQGTPYPLRLVVPPIFGMAIAAGFWVWVVKKPSVE